MSGEQPSDPYCHRKLREEKGRSNEEGYFEIFWALHRQKEWEKHNLDRGPKPTESFLMGYKDAAKTGWMARASLSVVGPRSQSDAGVKP